MDETIGQAVFVLGMHRSGTSWLMGALQQAGLHLGNHHTWNQYNRKGNRENLDAYELHEAILDYNGASWDNPPNKPVIWTDDHRVMAINIVNETGHQGVWGIKDPRTLLVLDGWKELLTDLSFVGIFRHPLSVWSSLNSRWATEKEQALAMWLHYNKRLLVEYEKKPFPLLCFDWDDLVLHKRFFGVCEALKLSTNQHQQDFFSSELLHNNKIIDEPLPDEVVEVYQRLRDYCEGTK